MDIREIFDEIKAILDFEYSEEELTHYGTPRHSGRYPWGSGKDPYQRNKAFLSYTNDLKKKGLTEKEIAEGLGMTTSQLRARVSIAKTEKIQYEVNLATKLKDKGMSNTAIAERMDIPESTVRSLLKKTDAERLNVTQSTANMLKDQVKELGYVDIGTGIENHLSIARTKLNTAIAMLEEEGYTTHYVKVPQLGTNKFTTVKVLASPDTKYKDVLDNRGNIKPPIAYTEDGGRSYLGLETPRAVSSKRIMVRYNEDGGVEKDGVIELRRGVDDISLGNSKYAQVRISVDGTHYLKGMAMYSDDMPDGVDIIFNTNKHKGTPKMDTMKKIKDDPDNPFGATVRQRHYIDKNGKRQLSALNIVNEEGDWEKWKKSLSSQVLSKQPVTLAKKQLDLKYKEKYQEYEEIMSLTNPVIKKKLLETFADGCDSSAVDLDAAALPRQASHVILPFPKMKENEIYAPNYRDGESVVLIRYPHGGKFEIPELTVNNKNADAKRAIGGARDAVGINSKVAERLSGADFDGDSVLVIPNNKGAVKTSDALKGLKDFDPKEMYPGYEGMKKMDARTKGIEMGKISNLITDMTIHGADNDELCRAVKHSMVVIDAEKHGLNYKQSYIDNGIEELNIKYRGRKDAGASTLISKASSEARVNDRKELTSTRNMTPQQLADWRAGKKVYVETGETYTKTTTNAKGEVKKTEVKRTQTSTKMAETDDAFTLSSGTRIETVYATHANKLKALANESRKAARTISNEPVSPSAKKTYADEVASLKAKLNIAKQNAPLERRAQILANTVVSMKTEANPDMSKDDLKKVKSQALAEARNRVGAKRQTIEITDREWEAIQARAVSTNVLTQIIDKADLDALKERAMPRTAKTLTPAKLSRAKAMLDSGYTRAQVADQLGISVSSLSKAL